MNRIDSGNLRCAQDIGNVPITQRGIGRSDTDFFISRPDMHRKGIRLGMNRDGLNTELLARANDSQRNFSTIGDQHFFKHVLAPTRWRESP